MKLNQMCAKLNPFFSPSTKKSSCGGYPRREEVQESAVPLTADLSITEHTDRRRQTDGRSAVCVWRQLATNHLSVHQLCNIFFCMFRKKNTCHVLGLCRVHLQHVDACAATISYIILYMTDLLLVLKELPCVTCKPVQAAARQCARALRAGTRRAWNNDSRYWSMCRSCVQVKMTVNV